MKVLSLIFMLSLLLSCKQVKDSLKGIYLIDSKLTEISGMIRVGSKYFAHNDSGDDPVLYELDISTGEVKRQIHILNAQNIDWEDIAVDENYIFIGDIGGNNDERTQLSVYKVQIDEVLNNDSVYAEIITIKRTEDSPRDFEAMFVKEDKLYLLSKDIEAYKTKVYKFSLNSIGHTLSKPLEEMTFSVAITGADYNHQTNELGLIGYSKPNIQNPLDLKVNIIGIKDFKEKIFENRNKMKTYNISNAFEVLQAESITFSSNSSKLYIASEKNILVPTSLATMYSFTK